ncbi:MAG: VOC family protein [Flavobacterium sp.]|uniref:VOC family protein n=1 Tax=Flavobacterium sp. TaxID=239 RepID=UPI003267C304
MTTINPYLIFNGNCEAAFLFYKSVFGGEFPYIGKFSDMPPSDDENCPPPSAADADRVMHVSLPIGGGSILMGSDSTSQSGDVVIGSNVSMSLNTESRAEADKLFNGLSAGGNVIMAMQNTFWGAYFGMFVDKFGIHWMINFDEAPQK